MLPCLPQGQKEITLRDDVSPENRALLYKDFLMHTMSGAWVGAGC